MNLLIKVKGNYYSLLSLMLLFFVSTSVLAEGTRQMSPVNSANGTALVVWPSSTRGTYLNAPVDQRLQFTVDDHTTENLYFGFHTRTYDNFSSAVVTDAYYRIYNQAGTQVAGPTLIPTTGAGYIQDYNEAFAGPNIGGATPAGYTPFLFDPTTNGDFYIEIYRSSDGGTTSNNLEIMMPFFDFTVSDPSNNQVDGRVWCRKWSFATVDLVAVDGGGNNTYNNALGGSSLADFFVYTQDQQILSIDFQTGFNPLAFEITTNFYGISNTGNFTNDRRSTNNFTGVSPTLANGYQIFLNQPDLNIFPISPTSQPAITSNIFGCPGNYFIPYVIAEAGDISIFLDLNGTPGYQAGTADLVLEDYGLAAGNHLMAWNGLDGLGNVAPVNVSTSVVVTIYRGRTNIPLYDAELNTNGLIVTGLFPATNNRPLYWDDRLLTVSGGTCTGGTNNTEVVIPGTSAQAGMLDGVLGPSHAWDGTGSGNVVPAPNSGSDGSATVNLLCDDFGNIRTINTWFWALDASSPVTAMIVPDCDVDGDGIDDITDIDNDNDGILDVDENIDDPFGDNDGDLIYNYLDLDYPGFVDVNSDGINDNFDLDLDGLVNAIDHDSDGDGCLDVFEAGYTDVSPADGEVDGTGYNPDGTVAGSDGYGLPLDQNGNFVFDYLENIDTDGDGFGDNCDDDDDNDGIVDNLDNAPLDPSSCIDDDGDGCDDCSQTASNDFAPGANNDITNDGLDTDGDGICNVGDLDDDNDGCLDVNDTDPLVANPLNIVATATPGAICAGDPVNLSATGGATYTWDNGLGAGASHSVSPTTTTTYTVTGDNGLGCTSTGTVTVTVTPLPTTPVATNNSPICEGETLNLTASTITGATYAWTGPSSFTSTSQNPTVSTSATILMSGTYSVTATVAGCTSLPATTSVTVNTIPAAPTVSSNSPVCAVTGDINLTASTIVGATYAWTGPNSFSSTSQNPSITGATALNAGTYNVTATVAGCISPSATTAVVINNCGPTANDDVATSNLLEDGADGTINILGNDTDIDGTPSAPTNGVGQYVVDLDPSTPGTQTTYTDATGTWTYNPATGVVTFDPANDYNGTATITYELFDPEGNSDQAVITFTVDPVNDVPSQGNETLTGVQEDATTPTTSGDLTANNIDPDGTTTTVTTVVSTTGGGTTTITGGGTTIDYTPAPNFNGVDTVIYTVCDAGTPMPAQCVNDTLFVTVDPVNDAPSQGNETLTVNEDDPATTSVDLTTNNIDPDGTTTTVTTVVSTTGGGTTTITGGGTTIDYTPAPNFNGVDTVIYTVCDAGIPLPAACVNDTLFVTVNPINDAPSQGNETLTGVQEDATTPTTSGDLTVNNIDPDGTTTTVTTVVSTTGGGTTTITGGGTTIDYTPAPNFNGVDTVIYTVCDAGTPMPAQCVNDTLFVTVDPVNDAPSQGNETLTGVQEDATTPTTSGDLTVNNIDPDGTTTTVTTVVSTTGGGTTTITGGGTTIDYTPAPNFNGVDTVIYTVCDAGTPMPAQCVNDTLFVTVDPVNDAPSQGNETLTVNEDDPATTSVDLTTNNVDPDGTTTTVTTVVSTTGGGTTTITNGGTTIDYTPAPNFNGVDTVIYTVCDAGIPMPAQCVNDTLFVTVNPINDAPSQGNETLTGVQEDATTPTTSGDLTANNIDPDGTTTTVTTVVSTTGGGATTITGGGTTIDYTPAPNFNGVDTVIYTVCDAGTPMPAQCVNDTLFVTVDPVNDAPSQGNETLTGVQEDATTPTTSGDLTVNNIDPDGTTTTVTTVVSTTGGGTTTITNGGTTIDYTPAPNFNGVDTVIYTVCDAGTPMPAQCVNDTLFVTVDPVNDAPSQGNENLTGVQEDATTPTTSGDLTANNIDPDGTTTTVTTVVSTTGGGNTTITNGGTTIDYTPAPNFNGVDTVIYTVCDAGTPMPAACVNDTLFVTVDPVNDAPSQGNETLTVNEDDPATTSVDLTTNNIDPDGTTTTVTTVVSTTGGGTTTITGGGTTIDYTPAPNFNGVDTVIYTVCDAGLPLPAICVNDTLFVTVNPINDAPTQGNESLTVNEDDPATTSVDLTTNNIDPDGTTTTVTTVVSTTGGGTTTITGGGTTIDYTPAPNFNGVDTVIYTVCDAGTPMPAQCVNDTLFVTVNPINDAPVVDNENHTTPEDTPVSGDLTDAGDSDVDGNLVVTTTPLSGPSNGTIVINNDGTYTYTPNQDYVGNDTVVVTICDDGTPLPAICTTDTIFIEVTPVNDAPSQGNETLTGVQEDATTPTTSVDLTANNIDPDGTTTTVTTVVSTTGGGTTTITNGGTTIDYTPAPNFNGVDTVIYTVCDAGTPMPAACVNDTLFVTVDPINDAPSQGNETLVVNEDDPATTSVDLTTNNVDPDGTTTTVTTVVSTTGGGTTTITNGGTTIDYTPAPNFNGVDTVIYTVCDAGTPMPAQCVNDTLFVTVNPVNDPPVVDNEIISVPINGSTGGDLTDIGDSDIDGNLVVTTTPLSGPSNGTVVINPDGTYTYTPNPGYTGNDTVVVTICDDGTPLPAICTTDTIFITVTPTNPPVATDNNDNTLEDTPVTFNVSNDDTDSDGTIDHSTVDLDPGTPGIQNTFTSADGVWTVDANGNVTFTPNQDYNGTATINYTVNDNDGATSNTAVLTVVVTPVNDGPVVDNENHTTPEDTPVSGDLTDAGDSDVDGNLVVTTTPLSGPSNGTIVINNDGTYTYTPNQDYVGNDTVVVTICDDGTPLPAICTTDTIFIEVTPVNDAPSQGNETLTGVQEDATTPTTSVDLTTNNIDPDGTTTTVTTVVSTTGGGTTTITNGGTTIDYTPAPNFNGVDTVIYTVCDAGTPMPAQCVNDTLFVTVDPINDAPSQGNETLVVNEDDPATTSVDLTTNNVDPDGTTTTVTTVVSTTGGGTTTITNGGTTIDYTPAPNFNGVDTVIYTVCDAGTPMPAQCVNDTLFVTVNPINDMPVIDNEYHTISQNTPVSGDLTDAGDSDIDGNLVVTTTPLSGPSNGTITINNDGTYTYTPNTNFVGNDTVLVTICDDGTPLPANCLTDTIFITVIACDLNDPAIDCDGDGVTNGDELADGTDPANGCDFVLVSASVAPSAQWLADDCDGDGVTNGDEVNDGTNPQDDCDYTIGSISLAITSTADCDGDGVTNADEINGTDGDPLTTNDNTDPNDDCDYNAVDITVAVTSTGDCDGDGVTNTDEANDGTDPQNDCDFLVGSITTTVTSTADCDGDGIPNNVEVPNGDNPLDPCDPIQGPGYTGYDASNPIWAASDCDNDGDLNGDEVNAGTPSDPYCDQSTIANPAGVCCDPTDPTLDCDGDGVLNGTEVADGTNPNDPCEFVLANATETPDATWLANDCDGDGVTNEDEVNDGTNPQDDCDYTIGSISLAITSTADCDGDGVTNADEINGTDGDPLTTNDNTDPNDDCDYNAVDITVAVTSTGDCDGDGVTNTDEANDGTDPQDDCDFVTSSVTLPITSVADCDGDGVTNADEIANGTNPQDDCDFLVANITLPITSTADCDGDGVTNANEILGGTDPFDGCSLNILAQTVTPDAAWNSADCDGDGIDNGTEVIDGTDPMLPCDPIQFPGYTGYDASNPIWAAADCDNDGDLNGDEVNAGTPSDPYCDQSTIANPAGTCCDPNDATLDCDGDGVLNGAEIADGTNPYDPCDFNILSATALPDASWMSSDCDGDGVTNADEVAGVDGDPLTTNDNTDPLDPCDYNVGQITVTVTSNGDCDGDGVTDADENVGPDGIANSGDETDPQDDCDFDVASITLPVSSISDCDGDGVINTDEFADNTNPLDPCDFDAASVTVAQSGAWLAADCDGDGVTNEDEMNGVDGDPLTTNDNTDPNNPCEFNIGQITIPATSIEDCDGDGVSNADEINGTDGDPFTTADNTDPNDECDFNSADITLPITSNGDCDGDGVTNEQEGIDGTDPADPCDLVVANQDTTPTTTWNDDDCDNDGLTNGEEATGVDDPSTPDTPNGETTDPTNPDTDGDGVTDGTEGNDGTNPNDPCDYDSTSVTVPQGGDWNTADCDGDGVTNEQEEIDGTNPNDPCDLLVANQNVIPDTAWYANDCDNDGLTNEEEISGIDNPSTPDTPNGETTDPLNPDSDGDGVTDGTEGTDGTNPNNPCDYDSTSVTVTQGGDWNAADCDGDGVTNEQEVLDGTDPNNPCELVVASQTATPDSTWLANDCDNDGLTNEEEITGVDDPNTPTDPNGNVTDPTNPDTDGDGVTDGDEAVDGTNPNDPCDLVIASQTVPASDSLWNDIDCDNDGLTNGEETTGIDNPLTPNNPNGNTTDPLDADTDGDGVLDGTEVADGTNPNDPCSYIEASITMEVTADAPCQISIPEGFSPNGDGVNDYFVIEGLDNYENVEVIIMNRWGNKVYESNDYQNDWDGTNKFGVSVGSEELPTSTYFYIIDLGEGEEVKKGYIYLNR